MDIKRPFLALILSLALVASFTCAPTDKHDYPEKKKTDQTVDYHGTLVASSRISIYKYPNITK